MSWNKARTKNITMWSGPRNISSAMMYAFANRDDCTVWDEPFYGWYLKTTGLQHPMRDEILKTTSKNADEIIARCIAAPSQSSMPSKPSQPNQFGYQKHMTQHMLPQLDRNWISHTTSAFLIRSPQKVLASFSAKHDEVRLADIGFVEQLEIFNQVADYAGKAPPVVDSDHFLTDPKAGLKSLCSALEIAFSDKMLSWPAGPKPFDGIWASHWYGAAHKSTSFQKPVPKKITLPPHLQKIAEAAEPYYRAMLKHSFSSRGDKQ